MDRNGSPEKQIRMGNQHVVDISRTGSPLFRVDPRDCDALARNKGGKTSTVEILGELSHWESERTSVVLEELFHGIRVSGDVGEGGVSDGEESRFGGGEEQFGGDLEEGGRGGEAVSAKSEGGGEGDVVGEGGLG